MQISDDALREIAERNGWNIRATSRECGRFGSGAFERRIRKLRDGLAPASGTPVIMAPPSPELPIADLVADRKRRFELRSAHEDARKLIPVTVRSLQPIGILHFGDPHIDDDGSDISLLEEHARLVRETPGLYGATVGDITNNWIGRLAHLYSQQSTTACEAWRLAEWFIGEVRDWLYLVGGNHDAWSGAGDRESPAVQPWN